MTEPAPEKPSPYQARKIPMKAKETPDLDEETESGTQRSRLGTPNPWYHHQKRKLLLQYQKQLLEENFYE